MIEIICLVISAAVSFLARLTVSWEFKYNDRVRRETAEPELCLSIISLMSETESNPDRRAKDSFASEVCRVNYLAKLNAPKELSDAIEKYSANYLGGLQNLQGKRHEPLRYLAFVRLLEGRGRKPSKRRAQPGR